jgi:mRNA interferase RelE/StbE
VSAAPWSVEFERRAAKDLERLDPPVRLRVFTAIEGLADDPHRAGLRQLAGRSESRLRVGDWRVIVELALRSARSWSCASCRAAARMTAERLAAHEHRPS